MEEYQTDIGWISKPNLQYLVAQGVLVITDTGIHIRHNPITFKAIVRRKEVPVSTQMYSAFSWIASDIKNLYDLKDVNAVINIMREGDLPKYPRVFSVRAYGEGVWRQASGGESAKVEF